MVNNEFLLKIIISSSIAIQFAAAVWALALIPITGRRWAWILVSLGLIGMTIRRCFTLYNLFFAADLPHLELPFEIVGLVTSLCMLGGIAFIGPLFLSISRSQEELKKSEKKLWDVTNNIGEGIYVFGKHGKLVFMNPEAERLIGWSIDELNYEGAHNLIHCHKPDGSLLPIEECGMYGVIKTGKRYVSRDEVFFRKDGTTFPISVISAPIFDGTNIIGSVVTFRDITEQKKVENEKEQLFSDLQESFAKVKLLSGLIPICASCKKIRDDKGYWNQIESYIKDRSEAEFSHGICPDCAEKLYGEYLR
jgi:PAS domain S-box-containing protein